jgi:hypothetical protein
MNEASANPGGRAGKNFPGSDWPSELKYDTRWTRSRWLMVFAFIFATQVALIFLFGQKKPVVPRTVKNIPTVKLANAGDELLALNDPTLFALPHPQDFASAKMLAMPGAKPPSFRWTEPPRWLPLATAGLGAALNRFTETNFSHPLDFKPASRSSAPAFPILPLPQNSTLQIEGELAQRQLPSAISLTNWPYANVIAPSLIQVLAGPMGNVISTVLLPPGSGYTTADQYEAADERALELARSLHFKPAPHVTVGEIIFNWHTVPPPASP